MPRDIKLRTGLASERNTRQALQIVAKRLLDKYRDGIRYGVKNIEAWARGENESDYFYVDIYFNERLQISLGVDWLVDADAQWYRDADTKDVYISYPEGPRVRVNYPSYGSWTPGDALAVMTYYKEFCEFALQLEMALKQNTFLLHETAAEETERERLEQEHRVQNEIKRVVDVNRKNMKVGNERTGDFPGVPEGVYDVEFEKGKKRFKIFVTSVFGKHVGNIVRVA